MITPAFEITQDATFLTISIKVPYARVSEVDVYVDGDDFKFYMKPYFLRLSLPGRIVEDGRQKATYDADKGVFTICVPKETPEQHFEGLDLLTSLLAPRGTRSCKPLVEEIDSTVDPPEDEEDFDWQIEQTPYEEAPANDLNYSYGFGNLRSGVFSRLQDELNDIIDLRDPDTTPASDRTQKRLAAEDAKFDPDHYLADLFEDEAIQRLLMYQPWWAKTVKETSSTSPDSEEKRVAFTESEKDQLRQFTNKSYLLDKKAERVAFLGLIDVLLAYCYEVRATEGERNNYNSVKEVLVSFGRRVLCYPLYRHFGLVTKAIKDSCSLLTLGKAAVLKCLLDIHAIFQENDPAYILNDLYITDYCVWIQKVKSKKLASLLVCVQEAGLSKDDVGFELAELEEAARLVQEEENEQSAHSASDAVPRQPDTLLGSDTTSSDSSTETDDSSSEEEEDDYPSGIQGLESEKASASLQKDRVCLLQKDLAPSQKSGAMGSDPKLPPDSMQASSQLIEIIDGAMKKASIGDETVMVTSLSENVSGHSQDGRSTNCAAPPPENIVESSSAREYLEVTPRLCPLFVVSQNGQEEDSMLENVENPHAQTL
uniref:Protein SHQ1 homolog n=1 Tax=Leptobrachium leishanense TaxID=445787 RepID=A0A8C5R386_9ANUR